MIKANDTNSGDDPFQLNRFISAQERIYASVVEELRDGQKQSHWMWYIFRKLMAWRTVQPQNTMPLKALKKLNDTLIILSLE